MPSHRHADVVEEMIAKFDGAIGHLTARSPLQCKLQARKLTERIFLGPGDHGIRIMREVIGRIIAIRGQGLLIRSVIARLHRTHQIHFLRLGKLTLTRIIAGPLVTMDTPNRTDCPKQHDDDDEVHPKFQR